MIIVMSICGNNNSDGDRATPGTILSPVLQRSLTNLNVEGNEGGRHETRVKLQPVTCAQNAYMLQFLHKYGPNIVVQLKIQHNYLL